MKHLFPFLLLSVSLATTSFAQSGDESLIKKNVSDTILQNRTLTVPDPFDGQKALLQLFPGKHYKLVRKDYTNELINWECKTCKTKIYPDVNEDANGAFPYEGGVATRLMNVMDFKDSSGMQYKVISFNHSAFDEDGAQTSRFTGGLLGLAKFVLTDSGWKLRMFQPAIGAYGAFSQCPHPKPLLIGQDQYAFMIKHSNGGGGGPFDGAYFLIAGANGSYQQVMAAYGIEKTVDSDQPDLCSWTSEYSVPMSDKKYFRDIVITIKGIYKSTDIESLPAEIQSLVKGKKKGKFTIEQRYVYKGSKGYELQLPVKAAVN
ncbi:hypothetical protein CLV51_102845 [Chitinophaga niastensis]|uniref:GLPGLI family protein n=1 Tax=Chitinophaga niastensis TaxID=536980 RepID=A0A2P8HP48_CHINA|nr:hypothetical protein [Chitinophaga niastensis]PSL47985.1 hypothetical protein CLV51_102845 [Chitinophaga niastensis]